MFSIKYWIWRTQFFGNFMKKIVFRVTSSAQAANFPTSKEEFLIVSNLNANLILDNYFIMFFVVSLGDIFNIQGM